MGVPVMPCACVCLRNSSLASPPGRRVPIARFSHCTSVPKSGGVRSFTRCSCTCNGCNCFCWAQPNSTRFQVAHHKWSKKSLEVVTRCNNYQSDLLEGFMINVEKWTNMVLRLASIGECIKQKMSSLLSFPRYIPFKNAKRQDKLMKSIVPVHLFSPRALWVSPAAVCAHYLHRLHLQALQLQACHSPPLVPNHSFHNGSFHQIDWSGAGHQVQSTCNTVIRTRIF